MNKLTINADQGKLTINKDIYGHFAEHLGRCIYEGLYVGEDSPIPNTRGIRNDVIEALKKLKPPVLRWPGGCFADEYHWMDGIGPKKDRPTMINTHWGGVTENNHFGTHEFFDLCEMLETEPYICGNLGSGTVQEMSQWVEYMTFDGVSPMSELRKKNGREKPWKLKYFGVGNESWGCGGNMRPEYYADLYRQYQTYCRNYGDNKLFKIACGPNGRDYHWMDTMMSRAADYMDGVSLHHYTTVYWDNFHSTQATPEKWFLMMKRGWYTDELVTGHSTIMDKYDPDKRIALVFDEWGTWYLVEPGTNPGFLYQQSTMCDAVVAGLSLNIFNNHCDRVRMANLAQTVNVLQAVILTEGEKMLLTPTYHVLEMYKVHQDATMLPIDLESDDYEYGEDKLKAISASASMDKNGVIHISLCNIDPENERTVSCKINGASVTSVAGRVITSDDMNEHNTFDSPDNLVPTEFNGSTIEEDQLSVKLPAMSVVMLEVI